MDVRALLRSIAPPVVVEAARALRDAAGGAEWSRLPGGWPRSGGEGWAHPSVVETQRARWPSFVAAVSGPGPVARSPEADATASDDIATHNTFMVFAYVLARAARGRERIALLDWGGGLGQYAVLGRALLPEVAIEYHCRDTAGLVAAGRELLPDGRFHDDDAACLARDYDLVLASSSLQYAEDWAGTLARLAAVARGFLLVTRMPVTDRAASYVAVQRPHRYGYHTTYPGWVLNRRAFLDRAAALGLALDREFLIDERPHIQGAPEPCRYRGFLFRPGGGGRT